MERSKVIRKKLELRAKRKKRIRAKISGTTELPRLSVFKSNKFFYAQVIDDVKAHTVASVDGAKAGLKANKEDVKKLAVELANSLKEKNLTTVVFDRNGYLYHGVVASFADTLRENGIKL
jgi:large subunit ribosomal protein L18